MPTTKSRPYRVLSLSGGGFLGLYSACVLEQLEARAGEPLGRRFDLIAGTSIGGILALALAYEVPMSTLRRLFLERGKDIFPPGGNPSGAISRVLDFARSALGPKYSGDPLREALREHIGERTLEEAMHNVVVPAVNVSNGRTKVFKTPHGPTSRDDAALQAVDVAMATSAAPGYFPSVRIGEEVFADGGVYATAPDHIALHEAEHFIGVDRSTVRMLSIGTATAGYVPADGVSEDASAVGWLSEGRLVLTLISVQQQHVKSMMEDCLGDRYLRLDAAWPEGSGLGLDVATADATDTLQRLARQTMRVADTKVLDVFLK
ncbi:MAG TPA: CBASS cGAMP-activated phospholipase [Noviherbaspirillum sp.]